MRERLHPRLLTTRVEVKGYDNNEHNGLFLPLSPEGRRLKVIVSDGDAWDHVSVSVYGARTQIPSWSEMQFVKGLVFEREEVVMELHVADADHLNYHPGCLHLWRPQEETIPLPPSYMVAIKEK